jgi:transcriptional regulator with XRE-family HTH domain
MQRQRRWVPDSRPITDDEVPYLRALGDALRDLRRRSGLTGPELATAAQISAGHFGKLVGGTKRTRRSTLGRLVGMAVEANPALGPAEPILERLCEIAGPALVVDSTAPVEPPSPPTDDELRRLWERWWKLDRATRRARTAWYVADGRYERINGRPWIP